MNAKLNERPFRVLCVDGGGYLGLATAAFLRCTEQHFGVKCRDQFDLFVGTSTGGLIALCLADGMTGEEVEQLYLKMGPRVFPGCRILRALLWLRHWVLPKYNQRRLREVLSETFAERKLQDLQARGKFVAIPAQSAGSGMPRIFKTNHNTVLTRDAGIPLVDVALATSAAPTFFPAAEVDHDQDGTSDSYVDGGVFANNPSLIGLVEALSYLAVSPPNLEILSIATPRPDLRRPWGRFARGGGLIGWAPVLPDLFINAPSQLTDRAMVELAKVLKFRYVRVPLPQGPKPLPMDSASRHATKTLVGIGVTAASANDRRSELKSFFGKERVGDG